MLGNAGICDKTEISSNKTIPKISNETESPEGRAAEPNPQKDKRKRKIGSPPGAM